MSSPGFAIRHAGLGDLERLAVFAAQAFRDTYGDLDSPDDIEAYVGSELTPASFEPHVDSPESSLLVAELDGVVVGYALVARSPAPPCVNDLRAVELSRLYLGVEVQGKGYGAALLRAVHAEAGAFQATQIWLGVYDRNLRARAFYRRWGFVDVGTRGFLFGGEVVEDPVMTSPVRLDV